ncbi:fibrinogen silencer-binding protein [Drosophila navojoa]|uniref:fibrinogen silencer-binding protein n=1 Tax=Drosophila navojoa TaxID=7232 RepID=UPI000846C2FE|nr:fibrinogen silencer-binding protein [Drosophila navojoa]
MTSRRQRTRMPNFTVAEEDVLRALTAKYYKQIEEKTSNASVWRVKNRAWENIAIEFFKNTRIQRSAVKLKSKYETMKKLNKLSNVSIKREPTPVENSLRLVGQNGKVGEPKVELVQVEVEPAKLFDLVKTEIHSKENADLVNQDQAMSVHPHAEAPFDDGDQIMTEDDKSQAARLSAESTEKGVRDIRELVQTNFSQVGV